MPSVAGCVQGQAAGREGKACAANGDKASSAGCGAGGKSCSSRGVAGCSEDCSGAAASASGCGGGSGLACAATQEGADAGCGVMCRAASGGAGAGSQPCSAAAGSVSSAGNGAMHTSAATPSAGCAKRTPRPANGNAMQGNTIYTFPSSYDGQTPAPLLLALHAAGNPNTQLQKLTQGSRLETNFVRAFPKSKGNAWVYDTDAPALGAVLDDLLSNYCIDSARVFATGHSSGAQMVVQMLCHDEKRFRGVAPVAASKYCAKVPAVPVLYIQGMMDAQRGGGNGEDVVKVFTTSNQCGDSSMPLSNIEACSSSFDHMQVIPGCVSYMQCSAPTLWCSHNDNGYNNSDGRQHGWPCFATDAIADFFLSL